MSTMTYRVHAVEQDLAGKWYARACISDDKAVFLKFQDYPTMEEIQDAAAAYVAAQAAEPGIEPTRARDELGRFIPDDPATPDVNEAWTDGAAE